ncbi:hypothetical protein PGB28_19865, partial [Primorskyibacter aestuariivivens]|uniref:hypothetical protein n=1 Tax=Primorskyibacter aestuariivivens TaxID=1888912 RepID=UPI0023010057
MYGKDCQKARTAHILTAKRSFIDGVDTSPRNGIAMCQYGDVQSTRMEEVSMNEVTIIGIDL